MYDFRVGFGQDSHRFSDDPEKKLVLGGARVNDERGLEGNSDGDVAIHAICRSIEQALGNPDFDTYSGEMCDRGITDSKEYLKVAVSNVEKAGYGINNLGVSFECQKPKISPIASEMKRIIGEIMGIDPSRIGINATTGEDLTAFGRGEGIQVFAVVSLIKNEED